MKNTKTTYVHEGNYVREALRQADLEKAGRYGRIYEMHLVGRPDLPFSQQHDGDSPIP